MPRGTYSVQEASDASVVTSQPGKHLSRDTSYRSCIHALVIFVILCIVLMLAAWPWRSQKHGNASSSYAANRGNATGTHMTTNTHMHDSTSPSTTRKLSTTTVSTPVPTDSSTDVPSATISTPYSEDTDQIERKPKSSVIPDIPTTTDSETVTDEVASATSSITEQTETHVDSEEFSTRATEKTSEPFLTITSHESLASTTISPENDFSGTWEPSPTDVHNSTTDTYLASNTESYPTTMHDNETESSSNSESEIEESSTTVHDHGSEHHSSNMEATTTEASPDSTEEPGNPPVVDESTTQATTEQPTLETAHSSEPMETDTAEDANTQTTTMSPTKEETTPQAETQPHFEKLVDMRDSTTESSVTTTTITDSEETQPATTAPDAVCSTSHCKTLASRMLSLMNHSVDPCEDFYAYSCGGLHTNKALREDNPEDDVKARIKAEIQNIDEHSCSAKIKFKKYYDSCLQYKSQINNSKLKQRIIAVKNEVERVGMFHTKLTWNKQWSNLTDLLSRLMLRHSTPLFDLTVDVDGQDPSKMAFKLATPEFPSVFRRGPARPDCVNSTDGVTDFGDYYNDYVKCTFLPSKEYLDKVGEVIEKLGVFNDLPKLNLTQTVQEIVTAIEWDVFQIEDGSSKLSSIMPQADTKRIALLNKVYDEMTVQQLQQKITLIDWKILLGNLINVPSDSIPDDTTIQVYFLSYFEELFTTLANVNKRGLHNALLAMYGHDLYVALIDNHDDCSPDDYCHHVATTLMPEVASSLYLSSFPPEDLQEMSRNAMELFEILRNVTEIQLNQNTQWLDEGSRSDTIGKLKSMVLAVDGGASLFSNDTFLNARMDGIDLQEVNYVDQSMALLRRYRRQLYSMYHVTTTSAEAIWSQFLHPYSTSGVSIYRLNTIVIPYGLMTWPLYEQYLPQYLRMARLGFVIAHEMAHHFDARGIKLRARSEGSMLSPEVEAVFEEYKSCHNIKEGYDFTKSFEVHGKSFAATLNGALSLNERLSDDTAMSLAWAAYKYWSPVFEPRLVWMDKSVRQLYFIALAQNFCTKSTILDHIVKLYEEEHLPSKIRVHTMILNSGEFFNVFECAAGSAMRLPEDVMCQTFPELYPEPEDIMSN